MTNMTRGSFRICEKVGYYGVTGSSENIRYPDFKYGSYISLAVNNF